MNKKTKRFEKVQKKNITMDYFLRNYFLLNLENEYEKTDFENVDSKMNEFESFLENNNIKQKTHTSFIKWCNDLDLILKDLEAKESNGQYVEIIKKMIENYQCTLDENITKKNKLIKYLFDLGTKISDLKKRINLLKKKVKSNNLLLKRFIVIDDMNNYNEILEENNKIRSEIDKLFIEIESLKKKINSNTTNLDTYDVYIALIEERLKEFKKRLYIIKNKDIIKNIINKVVPISFEDISINEVYNGLVVIVTDKENKKQAYVNPFRIGELNNMYLNMLGEDVRFLSDDTDKSYKLKKEGDYNEKYKK